MLPGSPDMTPKKILNSLTGIEKPALVAMVTKIWEFWHKIIRNLVYIGPVAKQGVFRALLFNILNGI